MPNPTFMPLAAARSSRLPGVLYGTGLLLLCAAYLQGGIDKLFDLHGAVAEMQHFGLPLAAPLVALTIALELGGSAMILTGRGRWVGALALAVFTLAATFVANRFWSTAPELRAQMENGFFEHLGLVGGFLLVAWDDAFPAKRSRA